ncbi:MAG: hypothetical protein J1E40_04870 [Oscillospiraceae bacterium]|nr:hypothetical protein [Oscillospiraceae bacterium]
MLKRARIFIEDKEWEKACEYAEYALDVDAGCAEAYLAKFMAEYNISQEEYIPKFCSDMIAEIDSLFDITTYNKASRFGDEELNKKLTEYNNGAIYNYADHRMHYVNPDDNASKQYYDTEKIFKRISGFKDSDKKAQECLNKAKEHEENAKKRVEKLREENYNNAVKFMEVAQKRTEPIIQKKY